MLQPLQPRTTDNGKLLKTFEKFGALVAVLNEKEMPAGPTRSVNEKIIAINAHAGPETDLLRDTEKAYTDTLKIIEKELGWVPKNYYTTIWMTLGMSAIGLPVGLCFSFFIDNMAFIAVGLPIGMGIGSFIGRAKDHKAEHEGKQLALKYP